MASKKADAKKAATNNNKSAVEPTAKKNGNTRTVAQVLEQQRKPQILPDLTAPTTSVVVGMAQTHAAWAKRIAEIASLPPKQATQDDDAYYASLTAKQKLIYNFHNGVDNTLRAADEVARSALDWYRELLAIYTEEQNGKQVCLLDDLPFPGSDKGNNPAIKKEPGQKDDGTYGMVTVDFYKELCRDLRPDLNADYESMKSFGVKGNIAKRLPKHAGLTSGEISSALARTKNHWSRFQSTIKKGITLHFQFIRARECPKVVVDYVYENILDNAGNTIDRKMTDSPWPFLISDKANTNRCRALSVSEFTNLDFTAASVMKNGGTFDEVLTTLARGTPVMPVSQVATMNWERLESTLAEVGAFFNVNKDGEKNISHLVSMATNNQLSDDYIRSLGRTIYGLDVVWKHIQQKYLQIEAADAKALADAKAKIAEQQKAS